MVYFRYCYRYKRVKELLVTGYFLFLISMIGCVYKLAIHPKKYSHE